MEGFVDRSPGENALTAHLQKEHGLTVAGPASSTYKEQGNGSLNWS